MKLITPATLAATAAARWEEQYKPALYPSARLASGRSAGEIHAALVALGPSPSPEAVDAVIGHGGWTTAYCDECEAGRVPVVQLGDEPDYDSSTASVCLPCLRRAVVLVEGAPDAD